jgi:hypothetical protein
MAQKTSTNLEGWTHDPKTGENKYNANALPSAAGALVSRTKYLSQYPLLLVVNLHDWLDFEQTQPGAMVAHRNRDSATMFGVPILLDCDQKERTVSIVYSSARP